MRQVHIWLGLLFFLLLSACAAPVIEQRANGKRWETTEQLLEYQSVKTGSIKVGGVSFPIYGLRWEEVDTAVKSGSDDQPVPPNKFDCRKNEPAKAEEGDQYCQVTTKYFLVFGELMAEVSEEVWKNHVSNTIYKTQEISGYLVIVP